MKTRWMYFSLFWLLVALAGCGDGRTSDELRRVAEVVDDNPELALARLDSVELSALNSADRHYFDFLSIKAADKAYIIHQSDSLIRSVIDYYQDRPDDELLPEVFYYGGRVYFDLGDAPQALHYFQQALDRVPADSDLELRGRIVSQMAQLYYRHYQYHYAIEKVKESIEIDICLNDTFGLAYDSKVLADVYLATDMLDSAKTYYIKAIDISKKLATEDIAFMKISLAYVLALQELFNDAKNLAPVSLLDSVSVHAKSTALSKYLYIYQCVRNSNDNEKELFADLTSQYLEYDYILAKSIGYGALAELDIITNNTDSLYKHLKLYKWATDSLHKNISQQAMNYQNSYFNYSLRERDNHKLTKEKHNRDIALIIATFALIIAFLIAAYFVKANKIKRQKLELAIAQLRRLSDDNSVMSKKLKSVSDFKQELVEQIQQRIFSLGESDGESVPSEISNADVYKEFCKLAKKDSQGSAKQYWSDLEALIDKIYPKFKPTLTTLLVTFSEQDYRICMLTKCGFSTTEIAKLTIHSKGAISSSRMRMCERAFGEKRGATYWDKVVRSL